VSDATRYTNLFHLDGRHALVIGGGSGIGAESAKGLAAHGASVTIADVRLDAAQATADAIVAQGGRADARTLDITDEAEVERTMADLGALDVLVCTPAINVRKVLLDYTLEEFERVMHLNMRGSFLVMRAAGRRMAAQGRGSIIFFSSIRSQVVEPGQGVYAATKAGTLQMIRALAAELGPQGVRANAVAPGVVETPLTEPIKANREWYQAYADKSARGRWAQASEMVGPVVYLASDASSFVTGTLLIVDGGWTAIDGRFTPPL
jgi:NAD(P)-dependent dehydrogenase (short-subunit alcohol dehydrogenase family)